MADHIRRRLACDRCHSQKLKCPRRPGLAICDRCLKGKKSCAYSPFRPKKVSEGDKRIASNVSEHTVTVGGESLTHGYVCKSSKSRTTPEVQKDQLGSMSTTESFSTHIDPTFVDGMTIDYPYLALEEFDANCAFDDFGLEVPSEYTPLNLDTMSPRYKTDLNPKVDEFTQFKIPNPPSPSKPRHPEYNPMVIPESTIFQNIPVAIGWKVEEGQLVNLESVSECVQRLSQLSTKLYDHYKDIPPMSIHDLITPEEEFDMTIGSAAEYRVDECFGLTQEMIDIYPSVISICSHNQDATVGESKPSVDCSFLLLALSCHIRVIDIFERLFQHMLKCIETKGGPPNKKLAACSAPVIKVGSFQPPPSSAIPMQMLLLMQLTSQLSNHTTDLVMQLKAMESKGQNCEGSADKSSQVTFSMTLAAAEDVKGRANSMTLRLITIRNKMLSSGFLA